MKKFSALLVFVFAASLFANEAPPAAPAAPTDHHAKPTAPAKKKPAAAQKTAPGHKPTTMVNPTEPTAAAMDKPVEGGQGN